MRKFYLFRIQKKYQGETPDDLKSLYTILENLYYLNTNKLNFGLSIYNQLCKKFDKNKILQYFKDRFPNNTIFKNRVIIKGNEKSLISINESCIVLYTNASISSVLKYLNLFDNNIFVCDFDNKDYFWLKKITNESKMLVK